VSGEYLKLTTYFAERLRSGDRFLADVLLDLYGDSAVATSVVLRGIASFGPHHVLRSDQSLSASEDTPIVIAAVDRADKIAPLADRAVAMTTRGLIRSSAHGCSSRPRRRHRTTPSNSPCTSGVRTGCPDNPRITPCAICCTDADSPGPQSFSASTAPNTGSVGVPASSVATSTFPS
jgi:PII-like signaling protein